MRVSFPFLRLRGGMPRKKAAVDDASQPALAKGDSEGGLETVATKLPKKVAASQTSKRRRHVMTEQDAQLLRLVEDIGPKWSEICIRLGGARSAASCKSRFNVLSNNLHLFTRPDTHLKQHSSAIPSISPLLFPASASHLPEATHGRGARGPHDEAASQQAGMDTALTEPMATEGGNALKRSRADQNAKDGEPADPLGVRETKRARADGALQESDGRDVWSGQGCSGAGAGRTGRLLDEFAEAELPSRAGGGEHPGAKATSLTSLMGPLSVTHPPASSPEVRPGKVQTLGNMPVELPDGRMEGTFVWTPANGELGRRERSSMNSRIVPF